jgi:hypothetical protein
MDFQRFYVPHLRLIKNKFYYRFHAETETLGDKRHYYKIIGTSMDQKGFSMNFLGFTQVPTIIFTLKMIL